MEKCEQKKAVSADLRVSKSVDWNSINWDRLERKVKQLQAQIVKAEHAGS